MQRLRLEEERCAAGRASLSPERRGAWALWARAGPPVEGARAVGSASWLLSLLARQRRFLHTQPAGSCGACL